MLHHKKNRKLGRETGQRQALLRSLASNLILKGKIVTTEAKAKEMRPFIEKLITAGRKGDLSARRNIAAKLGSQEIAQELIKNVSPKFMERKGGYTRITKLGLAKNGIRSALIEFVD